MNLRFLDTYNDIPVEYMFSDAQYVNFEYQEQTYRRCLFENDQNYFLNDMNQQVKKEEDNYFVEQNFLEPLQVPTLMDCLAATLKLPLQAIQQVSQSNPIAFHKLIDKAKRVIRREKAKLRCKLRQTTEELPKQEILEEKLKIEELSQEIPQEVQEKSRKKNKSIKKNVLGKRKAEKLAKLDESMNTHSDKESQDAPLSHISSEISTENEKHQKKMVQMIRNRISAQNSRDRKKAYIQQLEANSNMYYKQNLQLQQKLKEMQEQNENTSRQNASLKKQLEEKTITRKTSFKQMGLTLLTLVSVYLMMGQGNEQTNITSIEQPTYKYTVIPEFQVTEPSIIKKLHIDEPRTKENLTEQLKNIESQIKEMMVEKGLIEKDFIYSDIDKNMLTHRVSLIQEI